MVSVLSSSESDSQTGNYLPTFIIGKLLFKPFTIAPRDEDTFMAALRASTIQVRRVHMAVSGPVSLSSGVGLAELDLAGPADYGMLPGAV